MPESGPLPANQVVVTFAEGLAAADRWPDGEASLPPETMRWTGDAFLLPRIPKRYDAWGILDDWKPPVLMRMSGDVSLPAGTHRILLRARALGRLWIDGRLVASTAAITEKSPDGEQPVTPIPKSLLPGMRLPGYRQQEAFDEVTIEADAGSDSRRCRVVLELIVGGAGLRTDTGEALVAMQPHGAGGFQVLTTIPDRLAPLTDESIEPILERIEQSLKEFDDRNRRESAKSQDAFWSKRHEFAKAWLRQHTTREGMIGSADLHPVDRLIEQKIATRRKQTAVDRDEQERFHEEVLPILKENCFRCHGEKSNGDLRLNARQFALLAGESGDPAIVPGDPDSSGLIAQVRSGAMPPTETPLTESQIATLEDWIRDGAAWPLPPVDERQIAYAPIVDDAAFLRRVYLDSIGVPPTADEARAFLSDASPDKRERLVARLLQDERVADHWMSYWQDVLAENPTLINPSIGSTGPFRWFLFDSLRDDKPIDRMVTELILMRGSAATGGSAAFALSGESDAPMAAKAHILASAFLGMEMQCARCHDSPYHSTTQRDLYSLAAMLERKSVVVPASSRVPAAFFERKGRESLIRVTLSHDEAVDPEWPFVDPFSPEYGVSQDQWMIDPADTRERLATCITAPMNERFAQVVVNRVWKRLTGAGIVEPAHDWEGREPSHPELLEWLAEELILHDYDLRHVMQSIMTSKAYMREAVGNNLNSDAEDRFFNAPDRRRLTAEQIVDSMHVASGARMDCEELTFVHDGRRPLAQRQSLGVPTRAWMLAGLNNERDRPSLALPRAQAIVDVLEAFGWNGSRQQPVHEREADPNVLQPGVLANGALTTRLSRAGVHSDLANLAFDASSAEQLVEECFLRFLVRPPTSSEVEVFARALDRGFEERLVEPKKVVWPEAPEPLPLVTWFNHLQPETNTIQQVHEDRVLQGPPADPRLDPQWRAIYEDFVWSLINHAEFVWVP